MKLLKTHSTLSSVCLQADLICSGQMYIAAAKQENYICCLRELWEPTVFKVEGFILMINVEHVKVQLKALSSDHQQFLNLR